MAKSARSSVNKKNGRNLRAKVFGPVHDARTERLSAKLQELAAKPKPETDKPMDVDDKLDEDAEEQAKANLSDDMDLDALGVNLISGKSSKKRRGNHKSHKITKTKPRNAVIFPSEVARRKKMMSKTKKS